jgi:hypothetical protein
LGPQFQITKHLNLADLAQITKFFHGCFEFEVLKVELDSERLGDHIIPPVPRFQILKHLYIAILAQRAKLFCGFFEFEVLNVELALQ